MSSTWPVFCVHYCSEDVLPRPPALYAYWSRWSSLLTSATSLMSLSSGFSKVLSINDMALIFIKGSAEFFPIFPDGNDQSLCFRYVSQIHTCSEYYTLFFKYGLLNHHWMHDIWPYIFIRIKWTYSPLNFFHVSTFFAVSDLLGRLQL